MVNFKYFDAASQQEQLRNTQYQPFLTYQQAIKTALMSEAQLRPKEFKDAIEQLEIDVNKDNVRITQRERRKAREREEGHQLYPSGYDSSYSGSSAGVAGTDNDTYRPPSDKTTSTSSDGDDDDSDDSDEGVNVYAAGTSVAAAASGSAAVSMNPMPMRQVGGKGLSRFSMKRKAPKKTNKSEKKRLAKRRKRDREAERAREANLNEQCRQRIARQVAAKPAKLPAHRKPVPPTDAAEQGDNANEVAIDEYEALIEKSRVHWPMGPDDTRENYNFLVPVTRVETPPNMRRTRDQNEAYVLMLMAKMEERVCAAVAPICLLCKDVKRLEDFDFKKIKEYKYEALGGDHTQTAATRLYVGRKGNWTARKERHILYRTAVIHVWNITDAECRTIGSKHNLDTGFNLKQTYMDRLRLYRNEWLLNYRQEERLIDWQKKCLTDRDLPCSNSNEIRKHNPDFQTARWPEDVWTLLEKISKMFIECSLKGSKKPKKGIYLVLKKHSKIF